MNPLVLLAWSFLVMSQITGPWGSGGWYVTQVSGFATRAECEGVQAWIRQEGERTGRVIRTIGCWQTH